ncbi:FKBP-type peptidyl-prolyl cis-trans isomerase [Cellulomonas marina]|uniref:peptidylprolyl isomerase n=1 Tax=Cellulomonas marina TaxID=988821 RepID=A0A1I0XX29_9CELL|nr:FKBP-type peptidyl-prolyl cis-trans isomerase [Cellulomonas marina]GIG28479.1 peptidylprolyl isomerase [Cellulomonas marina]SFB05615.1 peptidylprolyl isomerase [Cellulomonas marina]
MRRTARFRKIVAAGGVLTLGLVAVVAGCSADDGTDGASASPSSSASATADTSAADQAALEQVVVEGEPGAAATVTLPETPFTVGDVAARILTPGTGETLEEGQIVALDSTWVSGEDGSALGSTHDEGGAPEQLVLDGTSLPTAFVEALVGQQVGVRALLAIPGEPTRVAVVDIPSAQTVPDRAEGTAVTPPEGLPTVTLAEDGAPSIEPVAGDPPTTLVSQDLITGTGPVVAETDTVIAHYSGWLWDGTSFDSSWERGTPASFSLQQVVQGWTQGLAGKTVGSQVLLVIPPDLGYGAEDNGDIPGGSTLVFVVDLLGTVPAPAA